MTNFVRDNTTIPGPKVTFVQGDTEIVHPEEFCSADDYNAIRQALFDLRGWIQTGLAPGSYTLASLIVDADGRITGVASGSGGSATLADGNYGDVTASSSGTVITVNSLPQSRITGLVSALFALQTDKANVVDLAAIAFSGSANDLGTGIIPGTVMPAHTGDVTSSAGSVALTIAGHAVTNAKLAQAPANTLLGNNTGSTADRVDMTAAQAKTMLALAASDVSGLAPIATSGSANDLGAGTVPAARMPALTGPITTTAGTVATSVTNNAITNAMLAQGAASTVVGNNTGSTANRADLTMTQLSSMLAGTLLAGPGNFGNASDGSPNFDGSSAVTGWTRSGSTYFPTARVSWYFNVVTLGAGVTLVMEVGGEGSGGGCSSEFYAQEVNVAGGTATIKHNGATPTTNAQATNMTTGHFGGSVGQGAGGIQNAGQNANNISAGNWYNSRKAGAGGFGGASATNAGSTTAAVCNNILADSVGLPCTWEQAKVHRLNINNSGAADGGAGGGSGGGTTGVAAGGAGGNGGGVMTVGIRKFTGVGTLNIQTRGGNGAPGVAAAGSNAGGGSGGGGGELTVGYGGASLPSGIVPDANGGSGGSPQGTGSAGGAGSNGQVYTFCLGSSS